MERMVIKLAIMGSRTPVALRECRVRGITENVGFCLIACTLGYVGFVFPVPLGFGFLQPR